MKFSLSIGFCDPSHYLPLSLAADQGDWSAIAVPDGLFFYEQTQEDYPYSEDGQRYWSGETPFLDPFCIISAMAAVTERINFYPAVLKLAVRNPLLVAKAVSSCAAIADGRLALGVGLSPWKEDFDLLGEPWANRGLRSEEMIEVIRGLLVGGMFEHHGRFYDIPRLQIAPVPRQPIAIHIGGLAEPVLRRAAWIGDGYIGWENPKCPFDEIENIVSRLLAYRQDSPRAQDPFEIKIIPSYLDDGRIESLRQWGVTEIVTAPWFQSDGDPNNIDNKITSVRKFNEDIIQRYI